MTVLHEAYLYRDIADFVDTASTFVEEGTFAGEAVLVAVSARQIEALRPALTTDHGVTFVNMGSVGRNPGRIISIWRRFVAGRHAEGRGCRGIGEPIWAGRTAAELIECQRHEVLLNAAFPSGPPWRLLCPYDMATLPISVLDEALRSHPVIGSDGARSHSDGYDPDLERLGPWLPPAPREADELSFTARNLRSVRDVVARHARRAGLAGDRVPDLCLATHEVALNSVRHGGGWGVLRIWREGADLICEISDRGTITDPLVGRSAPEPGKPGGRGLWLANELCGLVRLRSREGNTVVRLHMST